MYAGIFSNSTIGTSPIGDQDLSQCCSLILIIKFPGRGPNIHTLLLEFAARTYKLQDYLTSRDTWRLHDERRGSLDVAPTISPSVTGSIDRSDVGSQEAGQLRKLMMEYRKQDDDLEDATESTVQGALMLLMKIKLEPSDVLDRGEASVSRYLLEKRMYEQTDRIVGELHYFLQMTAALVPGCKKFFRVDPEDALLPILQGCSNVAQLLMAWELLWARLELGQKFIEKYAKEFGNLKSIKDFSPASTTVELAESLRTLSNKDEQMRHMLDRYPHHNEETTAL
ncbi:hypothetical protein DFH07DRAFT_778344 [Mycena maculata]|uniref:Uncharacterized protein n=1 Tax=Mycena maculata TaxID=230809 RepID=A0AAD7IEZ8_9AGAR|nr:hypothetical protein DFH07DRAFT_778344 [Mycena maculata]